MDALKFIYLRVYGAAGGLEQKGNGTAVWEAENCATVKEVESLLNAAPEMLEALIASYQHLQGEGWAGGGTASASELMTKMERMLSVLAPEIIWEQFIACGKLGANADLKHPLRGQWERLGKLVEAAKATGGKNA